MQHLLYASFSSVYGDNPKVPFATADRVDHPVSLYAATKKSNELMAYTYSHLYRIPATGSPSTDPTAGRTWPIFPLPKRFWRIDPFGCLTTVTCTGTSPSIDDIVGGILPLIENSPTLAMPDAPYKLYNIGNNRPEKLLDFIAAIEDAVGKKAVMEFHPMQPGDVYRTYADVSDLARDAEFRPDMPIGEGISKFVAWYKE